MKTLSYHTTDKSQWLDGPWKDEPDKMQWPDAATGYPCLIVRNPVGALCGYVGVTKDHPAYGKGYEDVDAGAHGGLTFAGKCRPGGEDHAICHVVEAGEDDDVWWLGFDCAHSNDFTPYTASVSPSMLVFSKPEHYKDVAYVQYECAILAAQLEALAHG